MKQETLEEYIKRETKSIIEPNLRASAISFLRYGAKWQQERSYNEEEVLRLLVKREVFLELYDMSNEYEDANEWFKKFKK